MISIIRRIIETTVDNFTWSGLENIERGKGYLYISNHRDITLDSFFLQYTLFTNGMPTTATTLGDNLLRSQFIIDICRINRAVRVIPAEGGGVADIEGIRLGAVQGEPVVVLAGDHHIGHTRVL